MLNCNVYITDQVGFKQKGEGMKRKRFIKLLMARGYQRNRAAQIAHEARITYRESYKDIWENPLFQLGIVLTPGVCKTLIAIGNAAMAAANAFCIYNSIVSKIAQEYPFSIADVCTEYNRVKDMENPEKELRRILDKNLLMGY